MSERSRDSNKDQVEETPIDLESYYELGGGILSKGQYEYLSIDDLDLSNNAARQRRRKIRNNFRSAIPDLALMTNMEDKDLFKTFAPLFDGSQGLKQTLNDVGILDSRDLSSLNFSEVEDQAMGAAMERGIVDFLSIIAFMFDEDQYRAVVQKGLNLGQMRKASVTDNSNVDLYEVKLSPIPYEEAIEEMPESDG